VSHDKQQVWELWGSGEVLGTLYEQLGESQAPWIYCDFTPAPAYKKYMLQFEIYSGKKPRLDWLSTEHGLLFPSTVSSEKMSKWEKQHQELLKALNLSLVPVSTNAETGRVIEFLIEGNFVQMIAEFDESEEAV
jgi:hypothetical protein